jgi:hypothetical protein
MCRIDPIIVTAAHYMFLQIWSELEFPHGDLQKGVSAWVKTDLNLPKTVSYKGSDFNLWTLAG